MNVIPQYSAGLALSVFCLVHFSLIIIRVSLFSHQSSLAFSSFGFLCLLCCQQCLCPRLPFHVFSSTVSVVSFVVHDSFASGAPRFPTILYDCGQ